MKFESPEIPVLASYPKGADIAAIFATKHLTITYWDLWCLISAKHQCDSDLNLLWRQLVDRRLNERFNSFSRKEQTEDLIALVIDLQARLEVTSMSVNEILATMPERLLKKETQKGIKNITGSWGTYYPPSEPMLKSPRRLLFQEAMRGMWPRLPVDPTPIAEKFRHLFLPKEKVGYFPKGTTFALSRRIEKAIEKELIQTQKSGVILNLRAHRYAVHRAALTLFHEEHHWDDSYGNMGDLGKRWCEELLSVTADDLCVAPFIFLKDLLMFFCWENYGLSEDDAIAQYLGSLQSDERRIAEEVLIDVRERATQGFQEYHAESATRLLTRIGVQSGTSHLRVVGVRQNAALDLDVEKLNLQGH